MKRSIIATGILTALIGIVLISTVAYAVVKVDVCHRTGSPNNPYVLITVSVQSVEDAINLGGHGNHEEDAWHSYEFEGITYPPRNEDVFGSLIDDKCNLVVPTPTSTSTSTSTSTPTSTSTSTPTDTPTNTPTDTPTDDPRTPTATLTNTPTSTSTSIPTDTPTITPTNDPRTPTVVPSDTPTGVPTETPTDEPTETPKPPQPADAKMLSNIKGALLGSMWIDGRDFVVYVGTNAPDGTLSLPDKVLGASLYHNTIWVHRYWKSGWLDIELGSTLRILDKYYAVTDVEYIPYGVYPKDGYGIQYIASCYMTDGKWTGVALYTLTPVRMMERQ